MVDSACTPYVLGMAWTDKDVPDQSGRLAIVTGSNTGLGYDTARVLAGRGADVVMAVRDTAKGDAAAASIRRLSPGAKVTVHKLDLGCLASVKQAAAELGAAYPRIDLLINNAGRGIDGNLEQLSLEQLRQSIETNLIGAARMTKLVLPAMRAQGSGRIVSVSSIAGAVGQPFNDAYCASKFGLEGLMQSLALTVAPLGIGVSVVEAGPVATGFAEQMDQPAEPAAPGQDPYAELRAAMRRVQEGAFELAQPVGEAAAVVLEAALSETWRFRWQTSPMATSIVGFSLADLDGSVAFDRISRWLR